MRATSLLNDTIQMTKGSVRFSRVGGSITIGKDTMWDTLKVVSVAYSQEIHELNTEG